MNFANDKVTSLKKSTWELRHAVCALIWEVNRPVTLEELKVVFPDTHINEFRRLMHKLQVDLGHVECTKWEHAFSADDTKPFVTNQWSLTPEGKETARHEARFRKKLKRDGAVYRSKEERVSWSTKQ